MSNFFVQKSPDLERRRRLAEAMVQRGQDSGPIHHWAQGAGRLANTLLGAYQMRKIGEEEDAQEKAAQEELAKIMAGGSTNEQLQAMSASGNPQLQNFALQQSFARNAERERPKERKIIKGADGFSYYQDTGERVLPDVKQTPDKTTLQRNLEAAGIREGTPEYRDAILKSTTKPATEVNVGQSGTAFDKELGKENAQRFFERRQLAHDSASSLSGIAEARNLLDSGVITGAGANIKVVLGKALQTIGFDVAEDAIANSEAFVGAQAKQVANIIKAFGAGTGLSDADREFAIKAAGGDIALTEKSIRRILDINERSARAVIKAFNKDAEMIDPAKSPFPLTVEEPEIVEKPREAPGLQPGDVEDGYEFMGGDPADPNNWRKQ